MGKRAAKPRISAAGERELERYGRYLREEQDLAADTVRNYLSDLRQFAAFCEASWAEGEEMGEPRRGEANLRQKRAPSAAFFGRDEVLPGQPSNDSRIAIAGHRDSAAERENGHFGEVQAASSPKRV